MIIRRFNEDFDAEQPYESNEELLEFIDDLLLWFFDEKIEYNIEEGFIDSTGYIINNRKSGTKSCVVIEFKNISKSFLSDSENFTSMDDGYRSGYSIIKTNNVINLFKELDQVKKRLEGKKYNAFIVSTSSLRLSGNVKIIISKKDEEFSLKEELGDDYQLLMNLYRKSMSNVKGQGFAPSGIELLSDKIILNTNEYYAKKAKGIFGDYDEIKVDIDVIKKFIIKSGVDNNKYNITIENGDTETIGGVDRNTINWILKLK